MLCQKTIAIASSRRLEESLSSGEPADESVQACFGNETLRAVFLGEIARETRGLSEDTVTCLFDETATLNFPNIFLEGDSGPVAVAWANAIALCLSDEEVLRISGTLSGNQRPDVEQLRCAMLLGLQPIPVNSQLSSEVSEMYDR